MTSKHLAFTQKIQIHIFLFLMYLNRWNNESIYITVSWVITSFMFNRNAQINSFCEKRVICDAYSNFKLFFFSEHWFECIFRARISFKQFLLVSLYFCKIDLTFFLFYIPLKNWNTVVSAAFISVALSFFSFLSLYPASTNLMNWIE